MENTLSFDQLPQAVSALAQKLENIEQLLLQQTESQQQLQPDQLLTIQQAAEFLSLAVPTVYSMVSRRELPYMKRSKRLYFSRIELVEHLKAGRNKTNGEIADAASAYIANRSRLTNGK